MNIWAERLKRVRRGRGLRQKDLASALDIPQNSISRYETGERSPDLDTLRRLADYLQVSLDYLGGRIESAEPWTAPGAAGLNLVPVLGTVHGNLPLLDSTNIESHITVPDSIPADYAFRVTGSGMIGAGIIDGDLALCRLAEEAHSGQIVLTLLDNIEGNADAALKYYFPGRSSYLRDANPGWPAMETESENIRIAGILTGIIRISSPMYGVYADYMRISGHEDWLGVINDARTAGLKPEHFRAHIDMLRSITSG